MGAPAGVRVNAYLPVGVRMHVRTVLRIGPTILTRHTRLPDVQPEEDADDESDPDQDPNIIVVGCEDAGRRITESGAGLGCRGGHSVCEQSAACGSAI